VSSEIGADPRPSASSGLGAVTDTTDASAGVDMPDVDMGADIDADATGSLTDDSNTDDVDDDGTVSDPNDLDGDGLLNAEDDDVDGDGIANADDADADGDGFDEPTAGNACGSADGIDADSSNFDWSDNCVVSRFNQFADSLYAAGIQRVLYCTDDSIAGPSVDAFTDGEFGPVTETAVATYQRVREFLGDGIVGALSWASLQGELELVTTAEFSTEGPFLDGYTVAGERCDGAVLFYNEVTPAADGLSVDRLGWRLSTGAGSPAPVPFSIAAPFDVID